MKIKVFEVVGRKNSLCYVIATSKQDAIDVVEKNKGSYNLDMSGYYSVKQIAAEVDFSFDDDGDFDTYELSISAYHTDISRDAMIEAEKINQSHLKNIKKAIKQ